MATLRPFPAVRPVPEKAARVASVPYDVVDRDEARALARKNPHSFLHVLRPEVDLPSDTGSHADEIYDQAAGAYRRLRREGVLVQDEKAGLYLYRLEADGHVQTGVVGCCPVDEYESGRIKKHEQTRPDKERDRARHILESGIQAGPVFMTYRGTEELEVSTRAIVDEGDPLYDFRADDGVRHTVWRIPDPEPVSHGFRRVPDLYIADGHHRSAAAARARSALRERDPDPTGGKEYDAFLSVLFPADQLRILPYNRVVHDLAGHEPEELLSRLRKTFVVTEDVLPAPDVPGRFAMYLAGTWYGLETPSELREMEDPVQSLDAAILQRTVLEPLLEIAEPRTSDRIDFVGGSRGVAELARRVDARGTGVAFSLHPIGVDQLMAVADAGRILPPKTTWFEPKLRSGLLIHEI